MAEKEDIKKNYKIIEEYFDENFTKIKSRSQYINNEKEGISKKFSENGKCIAQEIYKNGKLDGQQIYYDPEKAQTTKIDYLNGNKTKIQIFQKDILIKEMQVEKKGNVEMFREFYQNGQMKFLTTYENTEKGQKKTIDKYDEKGHYLYWEEYLNGKYNKAQTYYDPSTKIHTILNYENGKMTDVYRYRADKYVAEETVHEKIENIEEWRNKLKNEKTKESNTIKIKKSKCNNFKEKSEDKGVEL